MLNHHHFTMKNLILTIAMMAALILWAVTSIALADDFKTVNGKEYKNATVSRVEPDGIVLKTKVGVTKVYFTELPKEVQQRFGYEPVRATIAAQQQQRQEDEQQLETLKERMPKYRIQGLIIRKTSDGLIVQQSNLGPSVGHNATDIPMGIKNPPMGAFVLIREYPDQENLVDGDHVDAVAYGNGPVSLGGSTCRSYTFFSR